MTSDNVSKFRPEIIERLESKSRNKTYVAKAAQEIAGIREISVEEGQELGVIADPLTGEVRETLKSPAAGLLFTLREYPVVYEGSLIARILGGSL